MKRSALVLGCMAAFAAATWFGGWWAVPALALLTGAVLRVVSPLLVGAAAGLAWLGLILAADRTGSLGRLLDRLGGVFGVPGWAIVVLAAGFAFLMGWSGARLGVLLPFGPGPGNR